MSDKSPMSIGFSVFNNHVNDANKKAKAILAVTHPEILEVVNRIEKRGNGIMALLDDDYVRGKAERFAAAIYMGMVLALVNEDRIRS